jgi:hypothetical protein
MTEDVLSYLLDATANTDIARYFSTEYFSNLLGDIKGRSEISKVVKQCAVRLETRIKAWDAFEDALSNTQGDFGTSSEMLKSIGSGEQSTGIWLESMILHDDLLTKLSENPVLPSRSCPPSLLQNPNLSVSHDEFITFVRAFIGVMSVLSVLSWADSWGNDTCRERILALLSLWQGVDGYRDVRGLQAVCSRVLAYTCPLDC